MYSVEQSYHPALQQANKEKLRCRETVMESCDCWAVRAGGLQGEPICPWASPIRRVCHACQRCHSCGNQREGMKNSSAFALTHDYFLKRNLKPEGATKRGRFPMTMSWCPVLCFHVKCELKTMMSKVCLQAGYLVTRSVTKSIVRPLEGWSSSVFVGLLTPSTYLIHFNDMNC